MSLSQYISKMTFITEQVPPKSRSGYQDGLVERLLTEAGVMLAMAEWLFSRGASEVRIHPDGMHLRQFDMPAWLKINEFLQATRIGQTEVGGTYNRGEQKLTVHSKSGLGDIVAKLNGEEIEIEAKGGCINTKHPGKLSNLRKGLHEAIGQLMSSPRSNVRLIAAVPRHTETEKLAERLLPRCSQIPIEIALVDELGAVYFPGANSGKDTL